MKFRRSWSLQSPAKQCHQCETTFEHQAWYFSVLIQDANNDSLQTKRFDVCELCEQEFFTTAAGILTHWKSRYQSKKTHQSESTNQAEQLCEILEELSEMDEPQSQPVRYLLALLLERNKWISEIGSFLSDQKTVRIYQQVSDNKVYYITDPELCLAELNTYEASLMKLVESTTEKSNNDPT